MTSSKTVHRFRKWDSLNGENHKARFGMSIASLGNINLDGITSDNPGGYQGGSFVLYLVSYCPSCQTLWSWIMCSFVSFWYIRWRGVARDSWLRRMIMSILILDEYEFEYSCILNRLFNCLSKRTLFKLFVGQVKRNRWHSSIFVICWLSSEMKSCSLQSAEWRHMLMISSITLLALIFQQILFKPSVAWCPTPVTLVEPLLSQFWILVSGAV